MDTPDETPTIAEALQRITDLAERAKREEAARQVDIMEAQGAIEALEVELLALRPKAQRAAQGEEALQALVLLGWPRETGLDPLEWAKEMRAAGPGEFEVQNSIWVVERKLAAVEKMLDDAQQQRDGKQVIIDRVRATIGVDKAESLQNRLAIIMADLEAHEIKEARDLAQEAIWPGRESRTEMSLVDLIGELAEGYKAAKIRERYIVETRAALGRDRSDGVTLPDAARQLVAKLAATEARDPCSTCRADRRAAIAERDQIAAKLSGADTDMRIFVAQIHDAQTQITTALGIGPTSATLAELVERLLIDRDHWREQAGWRDPALREAHRVNLLELRGLLPGHETADSAQVLRGAIDVITDLRQKTAGRETSVKLADMRMALDGLHDQLVAMGRKEMEHWAAREREIAVFGEETARLPWAGWSPPSIYPIEVYRAVVDKVIALQAAHDKVLEDDSRVVADAAAGIEKMQERVRELAEIKDLILASGRTMKNLSAVQVLREVFADAAAFGNMQGQIEKLKHDNDRARMNLDDAKRWEVRVLNGYRALAFAVDPEMKWPHPVTLPTSVEITSLCDRATSARVAMERAHAFAAATLKITT